MEDLKKFKENTRYITLSDGTSMNGELIVIRTNAPVELLKELENLSNVAYKNDDDVPLWWREVENKGYEYQNIDSCRNITPYCTSKEWLASHEEWRNIEEHYVVVG